MQYSKSFKEKALKFSDEIGVNATSTQLDIPYYTLSGWLHKPYCKPIGLTYAKTEIQEQENLIKQDFLALQHEKSC